MRLFDRPIAHRGLHDEESPENSMSAFRKAIEAGYNIETDVHLMKDGNIAAFHDNKLKRMVPSADCKIEDLTLEDLQGDKYLLPNGEHIPLFKDLLELVDGKVDILCEIKISNVFSFELERKLYDLIKDKPWATIQSFNPLSVVWYRFNAPEVYRGQLASHPNTFFVSLASDIPMPMLYLSRPNFLAYDICYIERKKVAKKVKKFGMKLLSWTINSEERVSKAIANGVDNLIFEKIRPQEYKK